MLYLSSGVRLLRSLTNQNLKFSSFYHNTDSDCKYYQWYYNIPSAEVVQKVPIDFLKKAYYGLHDLELDLAVKKVGEE